MKPDHITIPEPPRSFSIACMKCGDKLGSSNSPDELTFNIKHHGLLFGHSIYKRTWEYDED